MLAGKTQCSECEQLRNENALLRQQIALLGGEDRRPASNRWQSLLIVGWVLLTILPTMAACLASFEANNSWEYVGYGIGIGASWSQCSILYCILVLLEVRPSQKLLIFVLASAGFIYCWVLTKELQGLPYQYALSAPIVCALIAIPALVCRIVYRWQIAHVSSQYQSKPVSIASYLTLTFIVAVLISATSWLPQGNRDELVNERFIVVFGGPIFCSMIITIPMVRYLLDHSSMNRKRVIHRLFVWGLFCASLSLCAMVWAAKQVSPSETLSFGLFGATFVIVFSLWFAAAMLWLRLLGYRLQRNNGDKQAIPS